MKFITSSALVCATPFLAAAAALPTETHQNSSVVFTSSEIHNVGHLSELIQIHIKDMDCDEACQSRIELANSDPVAAFKNSWAALDAYMKSALNGVSEQPTNTHEFNTSIQTVAKLLQLAPAESRLNLSAIASARCPESDPETADICDKVKIYHSKFRIDHGHNTTISASSTQKEELSTEVSVVKRGPPGIFGTPWKYDGTKPTGKEVAVATVPATLTGLIMGGIAHTPRTPRNAYALATVEARDKMPASEKAMWTFVGVAAALGVWFGIGGLMMGF